MYSHVRAVYIIFSLINLAVMVYSGIKIAKSKSDKKYWSLAWVPIIVYSLYMGLRFGRMIDFNGYEDRFYRLGKDLGAEDYEPLFEFICYAFNFLHIPYQGFILFCSFALILSLMYFVKDYRVAMPYMLLIFMWESVNAENYIRWYLGVAFFLLYIYYLRKEDKLFILFGVAAITVHVGMIILVGLAFVLKRLHFLILPTYVWQVLLLLSIYAGSTEILSFLSPYVIYLGVDERSAAYAEKFTEIIEGNWGRVGLREELGLSTQIRQILAYSFPIYMIPTLIKNKIVTHFDANFYLIGIVIAPIFAKVEILDRISSGFLLFSVIVSGCSYWYLFNNRMQYNKLWLAFGIFSLISNVWPVFSGVFSRHNWWTMLFIWDANGRESLPTGLFL